MKRVFTIATATLLSLPLFAAEAQKEKPVQAEVKPAAAADSPLVAAAKRANRSGRKSIVITNDDVKNSKGHITTTTQNRSINVAEPLPTPEMVAAEKTAKAKVAAAEKAVKADAQKKDREKEKEEKLRRVRGVVIEALDPAEYGHGVDAEEIVAPPTP